MRMVLAATLALWAGQAVAQEGRYQIYQMPAGSPAGVLLVWILDTYTGAVRFCSVRNQSAERVTCTPWVPGDE